MKFTSVVSILAAAGTALGFPYTAKPVSYDEGDSSYTYDVDNKHKNHNNDDNNNDDDNNNNSHHTSDSDSIYAVKPPAYFTSTHEIQATPGQVVNESHLHTGGLDGSRGTFVYQLNSDMNIICHNISMQGFRGEHQSGAKTATHIHEGELGRHGPARIVVPNPEPVGYGMHQSVGCQRGPFRTGMHDEYGRDSGEGFHVARIEEDPAAFFTDSHSSLATEGAMRGQFACREKHY